MLNREKKHKITEFQNAEGVTYQVLWRAVKQEDLRNNKIKSADGCCIAPDDPNPQVIIDPNLKGKRILEVLLEEMAHAHIWDKSEKVVRRFSKNTAKLIIDAGWTNPDKTGQ